MSTERTPEARGFGRRVAALAAIAVLAVSLGVANGVQGPRLASLELGPELLVSRADQRVLLRANQAVDVAPESVSLTPAAPFEVSVDGSAVTLVIRDTLDYATEYTVRARLRGAATGAERTVSARFSTPAPVTRTLSRSDEGDRVLGQTLAAPGGSREVLAADRIQEYAPLGDRIAAVVRAEDGTADVVLHDVDAGGEGAANGGPGDGSAAGGGGTGGAASGGDPAVAANLRFERIAGLRGEARSGTVGFVGTGETTDGTRYERALLLWDARTVASPLQAVGAPGEAPLDVRDWRFVPGTTSVVVLDARGRLFLFRAFTDEALVPLGAAEALGGFLPGTASLAVAAGGRARIVDLSASQTLTAEEPPALAEPELDAPVPAAAEDDPATPRAPVLRSPREALVVEGEAGSGSGERLVLRSPDGARPVFSPAAERTRIGRVCLSPNAEYVAVETISVEGRPDGYADAAGFTHTTTSYVRIDDARAVGSAIGGRSDWCA